MSQVQVEQKNYQMPPQDGFTVAHFLTVSDIERSARFYETVFGGRILSRGDSSGTPGYHPDREHVAHCQRRGRSDTRQTIGHAERPRRPRFSQQLYDYPRCGYPSVPRTLAKSRSRVYYRANGQARRDVLLHSGS
jgi:catechol 2,3-dioxygenase-like lactoylglutathione lyase family enzyme